MIVIIGPDGCGKTTIAEMIVNNTSSYDIIKSKNFGFLPQLKTFKKAVYNLLGKRYVNKHAHVEGEFHAGMKHEPNHMIKELILFFWYLIDYILGFFSKSKNRTIFTRYYYDYFYQRQHYNLPKWLSKAFLFVVPKPDYIFFLEQDAEDIYKRKPELTIDEIRRQNNAIIMGMKNVDMVVVDARDGIESTFNTIQKILAS